MEESTGKRTVLYQKTHNPSGINASRNFDLSRDEFEILLEKLREGDDSLFEKVFLSQFESSIKYLMNRYKVNRSSAYDATMEALLKFRRRMLEGKIMYGNMRFLFTRMAGQKLADNLKKESKFSDGLEDGFVEKFDSKDDHLDVLDKAWKLLCDECRNLLSSHYYQKTDLKIIAEQLNKTDVAIRKKKQRCLQKLRTSFLKYYKS